MWLRLSIRLKNNTHAIKSPTRLPEVYLCRIGSGSGWGLPNCCFCENKWSTQWRGGSGLPGQPSLFSTANCSGKSPASMHGSAAKEASPALCRSAMAIGGARDPGEESLPATNLAPNGWGSRCQKNLTQSKKKWGMENFHRGHALWWWDKNKIRKTTI